MVDKEKVKEAYQKGYNAFKELKAKSGERDPELPEPLCWGPYNGAYIAGWSVAERNWKRELKKILESLESEIREK